MVNPDLERAAETHFTVRPILVNALSKQVLQAAGVARFPTCSTYLDIWKLQLSDRFFDMGTLIRIAASVETGLRDYYTLKKGYANLG